LKGYNHSFSIINLFLTIQRINIFPVSINFLSSF
jgi:hypothetical protein